MAPSNLQGLNIVHPAIQADSHDLLSGQSYPDLSAQLDLWTNLSFDSDEPLNSRGDDKYSRNSVSEEDEDEARSPVSTEKAVHDGHVNVVTGTNLGTNQAHESVNQQQASVPFDLNTLLAGFGIDPFALPSAQQLQQQPIAPSLAQLLAFHSAATGLQNLPPSFAGLQLPTGPVRHSNDASSSINNVPASLASYSRASTVGPTDGPHSPEESHPPSKRSRTRKASISAAQSPEMDATAAAMGTLSAAEDKRRRNTAASARFRMKKKEREAALEGKAKELEQKVSELERECEGLRRENGWLKGLVVGVTGAAQGPVGPPSIVAPPPTLSSISSSSSSSKRRRDDGDSA